MFGLFMYQTLDALDGKHARALGLGSPIGQLLDHGLDSFSASIFTMTSMVTLSLNNHSSSIWVLSWVNISYIFLANTEEFYTHVMRTNVNGLGVTEVQCMQMLGLGIQGMWTFFHPESRVGFFERRISEILSYHFSIEYPTHPLGKFKMPFISLTYLIPIKLLSNFPM